MEAHMGHNEYAKKYLIWIFTQITQNNVENENAIVE